MARRLLEIDRVIWALLAAGCGFSALFWGLLQRDLFFASDESTWFTVAGNGSLEAFLRPLNGHLLLLPFVVGRLLMSSIGTDYWSFSVLGVLGGVAVGLLMFVYARRRVGPLLALASALLMLFFGSGWGQLLQGWIGIQQTWAIAFGIGALLLIEHETRRSDLAASILLILSLASFTSGIAFTAGVGVATLLRNDRRRSIPIWLVPALLYGIWRVWSMKFGQGEGALSNLLWLPGYFIDSITATVAGTFGLVSLVAPGQVTALKIDEFSFNQAATALVYTGLVATGLAFAIRALRRRSLGTPFWSALAVLVTLWVAQGFVLSEGRTATELRYLYGNEVAVLLVVVAALDGVLLSRAARLAIGFLLPVAIIGMLPEVRDAHGRAAQYADDARADLAVIELASNRVDPDFVPATSAPGVGAEYLYMPAGEYLKVADRFGSPAMSIAELRRSDDETRSRADGVLARALEVGALHPIPERPVGCEVLATDHDAVRLPPGGAVLRAARPTPFTLRRFGSTFGPPLGTLPAGTHVLMEIPTDRLAVPWILTAPSADPLTICPAG